jgi:predicted membrane protein
VNEDAFSPVEPKPQIPIAQIVTGSILVVIGVGWLLSALDIATVPWRAVLAGILVIIGIALATASARGVAPGGLTTSGNVLVVILALLSTASAAFSVPLRGGFGERDLTPTTQSLEGEYRLIAGELKLSLGDIDFPDGETRLEMSVTFGSLIVDQIPDNVAVSVAANVTAGEIVLFGSTRTGVSLDESSTDGDFGAAAKRLVIEASVGFGQIEVRR